MRILEMKLLEKKMAKVALAALAAAGIMSVARAETVVSNAAGRLAVNFCRDDLVHFRYAPNGTAFTPAEVFVARQAIAKPDIDYAPVKVRESRLSGSVVLSGERLAVAVDAKTLGVSVSVGGTEVFKSAAEAFSPDGEGRRAAFVRDVAGEERFMGLGNLPGTSFNSLELRDKTFPLALTANNVHAVIPLWYSSAGYGVYLCNSNRGRVSFAKDYSVSVEGGEMNFYFIWGPSFRKILETWSALAGRMHMPPRYALGLTYRGAGGFNAKDLESVTREQQEAGVAVDVIGVEPGWHTRAYPCSFRWSGKFPDPKGFLDTMHGLGVKVNFWEHPYYSPDCPIAKESEPYGRWGADMAKAEGSKMRYGFGGFVPDMTMSGARDLYWKLHREALFDIGADGLKVDETDDWACPSLVGEKMPGGITCSAYRNLVGTIVCNFVHERFRDVYGRRTFLFSRGNWAGMQRWATSAYTDFYGFEQFVMSVIVQSCSGSYYTPEIRNKETPSDISYMRRAQMMFLTPFPMSNEWQENACVTRRSKEVFDCYLKYDRLHYSLVPYIYSLFREQCLTGLGAVRALPFEFPNDPNGFGVSDEFLLGPSLLVRPVADMRRMVEAKVYFPAGADWIDWWTGASYSGGETANYPASADTLPLFIRRGSIVPTGHYGRSTENVTSPDIDFLVVPDGKPASFTLYEDDGITFDYEKGVFRETKVTAVAQGDTVTVTIGKPLGSYRTLKRSFNIRVRHNGHVVEKSVPDTGREQTVVVTTGPSKEIPRPVAVRNGRYFECEAEGNEFENVVVNRNEQKASANGIVRNLGEKTGGVFTMRGVTAAKDGLYEAELFYANGDGGPRRLRIMVNGETELRLACPRTGPWVAVGSMSFLLPLKAGPNSLRFSCAAGDGWGPDLDCLYIPDEPSAADSLPEGAKKLVAERILDEPNRIGVVFKAKSAAAGPFLLSATCANASVDWQRVKVVVNGKDATLALEPTGSTRIVRLLQHMIYVKSGENTIEVYAERPKPGTFRLDAAAVDLP